MRDNWNYRARWPAPSRAKCHPLAEAEDVHQAAELGETYTTLRVYLYGTRWRDGEVPVLKVFRKRPVYGTVLFAHMPATSWAFHKRILGGTHKVKCPIYDD